MAIDACLILHWSTTVISVLYGIYFVILGKDHKENCIEDGMYRMQVQETNSIEKMQAFRAGWWQEEESEYKA